MALAEGERMTDQVPVEVPIPTAPVVVANDGAPTLAQPAKAPARTGPKWEMEVRDRVKASIKKFSKPLSDLVARDANEGDTRLLITDFLCEGLGYDKYQDLTTEYEVKGDFADYGVRIEKDFVAFIEVKLVATQSNDEAPAASSDVRSQRRRRVADPDERGRLAGVPPDGRAAGDRGLGL